MTFLRSKRKQRGGNNMITRPSRSLETSGNIILMVLVMVGAALLMVGAALRYTFSSNKQSFRYNQYTRTVSAAEAATEKVLVYLNDDFQSLGQGYVGKHLDSYRAMVPTASEDPNWANYKFTNLSGTNDRVHVEYIAGSNLVS